jgi:hypothetical protein
MVARKAIAIVDGKPQQLPAGDQLDGVEPAVTAGDSAQYYRGDKTWANLAEAVRGVVLTGLSTATNAVIAATDTILQALGKLQAQINNRQPLSDALTSIAGLSTSANQLPYATGVNTYNLTSLTVFGRSLIDDADASAARATLSLGTSATRDATTSASDTTSERLWRTNDLVKQSSALDTGSGKVLINGAYGFGAPVIATDMDTVSGQPSAFYSTTSATTFTPPAGLDKNGSLVNQIRAAAGASAQAYQTFLHTTSGRFFYRAAVANAWIGVATNNGWREFWHDQNFDPTLKANLASPSLTGTPTAPTAALFTDTTQLANMAALLALVRVRNTGVESSSSTAYTLVLADAGKWKRMTSASAVTVTVPPNSSVAFPVGTCIDIERNGAGSVTIAAGAGVTLRTSETLVIAKQYGVATIKKVATDEWVVVGYMSIA